MNYPSPYAVARCAYEAVRAFAIANGDNSKPGWYDLPEDAQERIRNGVEALIEQPGRSASENHHAWFVAMTEAGWSHGAVHDKAKKTHPALVPYQELSADYRQRNEIFLAIVRSMMGLEDASC